jgi:membrane protein DedA with SNARE-associated domain
MVGMAESRTGGAVSLVSCTGGWPSRRLRIFIGPMRTVVPLPAGIFAMPMLLFQTSTIASAFVWAFIMLAPGAGLTALAK